MANEKRLIDANAFRNNLEVDRFGYTDIVKVNIALDKSTVDAVEVVHGRWIDAREYCGDFMCSNCNALYGTNKFNYCPNCGAKMDGGNEDA
jgi:Zn finger protein HypA/HybF involved in hydrogenase expression